MNNSTIVKPYSLAIDATNLRRGGGVTHLIELLRSANPKIHNFERIVIWGPANSLKLIDDKPWLVKHNPPALERGLLHRTIWQSFCLSKAAREEGCSVMFVPGGSYAGSFFPVVTMSQNLLPFEISELKRFGWSFLSFKLLLLRFTQSRSFIKSDGIIFLTEYARRRVESVTGNLRGQTSIVSHGLNNRFSNAPKPQKKISEYNSINPYRLLYVSIIDQYKHQWHVVEAVSILRKKGFPIKLDLVGPAYKPALHRLNGKIMSVDKERLWVNYHGAVPFEELHHKYAQADLGLFASSCENMPNILLETMAAGLPIACSNKGPMPEMLKESGIYFNPEQPENIANALYRMISSPTLRTKLAEESYLESQKYSWNRCADETFSFINKVVYEFNQKQ